MAPVKKILKSIVILSLISIFIPGISISAEELTARQVMEKVDVRDDGDTVITNMTMVLIDKNNKQRIRQIKNYRKDYGEDSKSIIFFLSPADVRNTSYLSYTWDDENRDDDSWLYLPALRKVKRISSNDKSGSFMGSDFTYSDINGIETSNWEYKFIKETDKLDGHNVWLIEGRPQPSKKEKVIKETGYLKVQQWVRKDNFVVVKAKYWVKKGKKIKYFYVKDIRQKDGIWTNYEMNMVTTRKGKKEHSSIIKISDVIYNNTLDDSMFTTQRMERGL